MGAALGGSHGAERPDVKLELRGITKRFGTLTANDAIDLVVEPGEIHALLGENGAGKSTLMNVLYGLYAPDEGEILVDEEPVTFRGPGDAMAAGIGMVHQHFMLIPVFTVAENVMLGHEETRRIGFLDRRRARRDVEEISRRYRLDVPPSRKARMTRMRSSVSCGVSTAVGSSRMSTWASRLSALMISTRCWTPTGSSSIRLSGSTASP